MDDGILKMFIDEVFAVYDKDKSGTLEEGELHTFFNQLFASFNDPRRFDKAGIAQIMQSIDMNRNGRITKPELFTLFKTIWDAPPAVNTGNYNNNNSNQNVQYGQQQYGQQYQQQYQQPPAKYNQQGWGNNQQQANQQNNQGNQYGGNNPYGKNPYQ